MWTKIVILAILMNGQHVAFEGHVNNGYWVPSDKNETPAAGLWTCRQLAMKLWKDSNMPPKVKDVGYYCTDETEIKETK